MSVPYLRQATSEDMNLLFQWANDETTRQNAFNTEKISLEEHKQWFNDKLTSDKTILYIYCIDNISIGQIRVDIDNNIGVISYSIDSAHRKQGHGSRILEILESTIKREIPNVEILIGKVKNANTASQKLFERLKYQSSHKDSYIEYEKHV